MANGYHTGQRGQALTVTVGRDKGQAVLSSRDSRAADSPSGVSLKPGRDLCRSSRLLYEYSGKIPQFKPQLSHLFARSWVYFLICDIHRTHWLLGTTNWYKTDLKAHCNLKTPLQIYGIYETLGLKVETTSRRMVLTTQLWMQRKKGAFSPTDNSPSMVTSGGTGSLSNTHTYTRRKDPWGCK